MPIQFRCQFCRQRLGIADSRAGALVDCPACGRSLRVPDGDAGAGPPSAAGNTRLDPDPELHSALQQLSKINAESCSETVPNTLQLPLLAEPELLDDVGGNHELSTESANLHDTDTPAPATVASLNAPRENLADALAELAAQPLPTTPTPPRSPLRRAFPILIPVLSALLMFSAGYLAARSTSRHQQTTEPQPAAAASDATSPAPTAAPQPVASGQISGVVEAANADGTTVPDAGALVIVAPVANPSDLRIDGRFLRDPPNSPGRLAITAALGQLGVSFTNAADDGSFSLPLPATGPCILIAVSRRNARPASAALPADTATQINQWFTSPSPITGRLQTLVQPVTAPAGGQGVRQNVTIPAM